MQFSVKHILCARDAGRQTDAMLMPSSRAALKAGHLHMSHVCESVAASENERKGMQVCESTFHFKHTHTHHTERRWWRERSRRGFNFQAKIFILFPCNLTRITISGLKLFPLSSQALPSAGISVHMHTYEAYIHRCSRLAML